MLVLDMDVLVLTASYFSRATGLPVIVIHDCFMEGFRTKVRTVQFIFWQFTELGCQHLGVDLQGLFQGLTLGLLGDDA